MAYKKKAILILVLVVVFFSLPVELLSAADFQASLRSETIAVGFTAVVVGTAGPATRITITGSGPGAVPPAAGTADAAGSFTVPVGPFQAKGTYSLFVQSGSERKSLVLEVVDQVADGAVTQEAEQFNRANNEVLAALQNSLAIVEAQINSFPPNDQGIPQVRQSIGSLRNYYREQAEIITTITRCNSEFASIAARPPFRSRWQDITQFYVREKEELRRSAQQLTEASDPAEMQGQSDWCARALKAKAVFLVANTIVERWRSSLSGFIGEKVAGFVGGAVAEAGMQAANYVNPSGSGTPLQQRIAADLVRSFSEGTYSVLTRGWARCKWDLILEALDFAVNAGLDVYMDYKCLTFSGKMAGHVHVEALNEKHIPYWIQANDWEGEVTLTCAKPESSAPIPVWGLINGKGKNFEGTNMLATLFPKTLALAQFLTTQPKKFHQALAYFIFRLEGTVSGNTITIKLGSPWVDMYNGLTSTFTSIVIPAGSPIPIVQNHKIPFQNAAWQLSRTLGREGSRHTIAMEYIGLQEGRRRVKDEKTRELKAEGARGVFFLKIDLCAGCPPSWKPDF